MKKERPAVAGIRLYKAHRTILKRISRKHKISQSEAARQAIEHYWQ